MKVYLNAYEQRKRADLRQLGAVINLAVGDPQKLKEALKDPVQPGSSRFDSEPWD